MTASWASLQVWHRGKTGIGVPKLRTPLYDEDRWITIEDLLDFYIFFSSSSLIRHYPVKRGKCYRNCCRSSKAKDFVATKIEGSRYWRSFGFFIYLSLLLTFVQLWWHPIITVHRHMYTNLILAMDRWVQGLISHGPVRSLTVAGGPKM